MNQNLNPDQFPLAGEWVTRNRAGGEYEYHVTHQHDVTLPDADGAMINYGRAGKTEKHHIRRNDYVSNASARGGAYKTEWERTSTPSTYRPGKERVFDRAETRKELAERIDSRLRKRGVID